MRAVAAGAAGRELAAAPAEGATVSPATSSATPIPITRRTTIEPTPA
jgi:hypothetical protein